MLNKKVEKFIDQKIKQYNKLNTKRTLEVKKVFYHYNEVYHVTFKINQQGLYFYEDVLIGKFDKKDNTWYYKNLRRGMQWHITDDDKWKLVSRTLLYYFKYKDNYFLAKDEIDNLQRSKKTQKANNEYNKKFIKEVNKYNKYLKIKDLNEVKNRISIKDIKNYDWFIIERYIKAYPKLLHYYIDDNMDLFDFFNKAELKFINSYPHFTLEMLDILFDTKRMDISFIFREKDRRRNQKIIEQFNNIDFSQLEKYEFKAHGYVASVCKSYDEVLDEGVELDHCCGASYAEKMANGRSIILKVRSKKKIDKAFVTCEIVDGKIKQFYGYDNKVYKSGNIIKFKKEYEKYLNMAI